LLTRIDEVDNWLANIVGDVESLHFEIDNLNDPLVGFFFTRIIDVFTKVATNHATSIAHKIISPIQFGFILGRNILERVVVLHETIHELRRKKMDGFLFQIEFEKLYDNDKWSFLQHALCMKGFPPLLC
jgi:hypothetical protein